MAYRRKRSNKGRKCIRRKRVHVKGHGYAYRCAKYGPKRGGSKKRGKRRGKKRRPFNRGKKCVQRYANGKCRSYGARPRAEIGRKKLHGPFRNKGQFFSD